MPKIKLDYRNISFAVYFVLSLALVITHEPFKNEAQAWLITRDLSLSGILNIMWYEGTPALWHMLLFPLVKLGLPYFSMQILHWLFALIIVWLLLYKSPFPPLLKILFSFSYYFLYEYNAIARNYSITILLLFLLAAFWKYRHKLPALFCLLIILLINSNLITWGLGIAVSLLFYFDLFRKKEKIKFVHIIVLLILITGFALVLMQILPREDSSSHSVVSFSFFSMKFPEMIFRAPANALVTDDGSSDSMVIPVFFFLVYSGFLIILLKKTRIFLAALISVLWCIYMFTFIYQGDTRHHGLLLIILIFFYWIKTFYPPSDRFNKLLPKYFSSPAFNSGLQLILTLCLITSALRTMIIIPKELIFQFSGAKKTARFLKENDLQNFTWIGHQSEKCEAILPYFPAKKFWYAGIQDFGSFIYWNEEFKKNHNISENELLRRINSRFSGRKDIVLILSEPLKNPQENGFSLIHQNSEKIFWIHDEKFFVYLPHRK